VRVVTLLVPKNVVWKVVNMKCEAVMHLAKLAKWIIGELGVNQRVSERLVRTRLESGISVKGEVIVWVDTLTISAPKSGRMSLSSWSFSMSKSNLNIAQLVKEWLCLSRMLVAT
jgi:hypothetical protein